MAPGQRSNHNHHDRHQSIMKKGILGWVIREPAQAPRATTFKVHPTLPNPNDETTEEAAAATAAVNQEVYEALHPASPPAKKGTKRKRDYKVYTPTERAKIARYAIQHGNSRAAKHFSTPDHKLNESTVRGFVKKLKQTMQSDGVDFSEVKDIPTGNKGRTTLLPEQLDTKVQIYLMKLRQAGGVINSKVAIATAKGLLKHYNRALLPEFGGTIELGRPWAVSIFRRLGWVRRKATKAAR